MKNDDAKLREPEDAPVEVLTTDRLSPEGKHAVEAGIRMTQYLLSEWRLRGAIDERLDAAALATLVEHTHRAERALQALQGLKARVEAFERFGEVR
jgi:hypothetical protein